MAVAILSAGRDRALSNATAIVAIARQLSHLRQLQWQEVGVRLDQRLSREAVAALANRPALTRLNQTWPLPERR